MTKKEKEGSCNGHTELHQGPQETEDTGTKSYRAVESQPRSLYTILMQWKASGGFA